LREFLDPVVNHFTRQTLPTVNSKHFFMNTLCIESITAGLLQFMTYLLTFARMNTKLRFIPALALLIN
jgi:hypothetical protein